MDFRCIKACEITLYKQYQLARSGDGAAIELR